jgi:hypothetical protein
LDFDSLRRDELVEWINNHEYFKTMGKRALKTGK